MVISWKVEPVEGVRERILHAAFDLFYREGIQAVGIDTVIDRANVAKTSLYHHFRSKDDLVAEVLRRRDQRWRDWLTESVRSKTSDPKRQIVAVFDALAQWFDSDDFRGCAFINAAAEFPDPDHPVRKAVREHKRAVRDYLEELATAAGERHPAEVAARLFLLMEGAIVTAYLEGGKEPARVARAAAALLISDLPSG